MDAFLQFLGTAGYPTTMVGGVLVLFFLYRKHWESVNAELLAAQERLKKENTELLTSVEEYRTKAEDRERSIDEHREARREAENETNRLRRQVEILTGSLEQLQ